MMMITQMNQKYTPCATELMLQLSTNAISQIMHVHSPRLKSI
jgi:hypothetical protein